MRTSRRLIFTVGIVLLLGACATLPLVPWLVTDISSRVPGWDPANGSYAFLVDLLADPTNSSDTSIQRGTISAGGLLNLPLLAVAGGDMGTLTFGCAGSEITVPGILALFLLFSTLENPAVSGDISAAAIFGTSIDALTSTDPGTKVGFWIYVAQDLTVVQTCSDESFDLDLKAGWNTVIATVENDGSISLDTGVATSDIDWYLDSAPTLRAALEETRLLSGLVSTR